jgi:adenosylcobinamide-phosphate synthase
MSIEVSFIAYIVDRYFGEFPIKHPVVYMGDFIKWYEKKFYKNDIRRGALLAIFLLNITLFIVSIIEGVASLFGIFEVVIVGIIASTTIAHNMLYNSVKDVMTSKDPKEAISMLVSRDTKDMSSSDINKASIETYSENLSDGVIAPLFYLLLFGLKGAFIYKAINTLDSMVGYRDERYEKFGKFSAILDDIANYIPSRITALLIALLFCKA